MNELRIRSSRSASLIEEMDRPLLILAVLTMILYLCDLRGMIGLGRSAYQALMLLILAHFFAAHGHSIGGPTTGHRSPLYLPAGCATWAGANTLNLRLH